MKKFLFFAFAISAVAMIACSDDDSSSDDSSSSSNGCTCTTSLGGNLDYSSSDLTYANVSSCSEMASALTTNAQGVYTVTCQSK